MHGACAMLAEPLGWFAASTSSVTRGAAMDSYAAAEIRSTQVTAISAAERRRQWLRECPKCAQPSHATVRMCLRSSAPQRAAAWLCACSIACACRAAHGSSRSARGAGRWSTAEIRYTRWCAAVTNRTAPVCQPSSPVQARPMNPQSKRCAHPCASYNLQLVLHTCCIAGCILSKRRSHGACVGYGVGVRCARATRGGGSGERLFFDC